MFINVSFGLEFIKTAAGYFLPTDKLGEFHQRGELRTEVEVMQKCILFVPDIDERRVETLDYFLYGSKVNVTNNELASFQFFVEFYKLFIL